MESNENSFQGIAARYETPERQKASMPNHMVNTGSIVDQKTSETLA